MKVRDLLLIILVTFCLDNAIWFLQYRALAKETAQAWEATESLYYEGAASDRAATECELRARQ
jgi:hypothetical protein